MPQLKRFTFDAAEFMFGSLNCDFMIFSRLVTIVMHIHTHDKHVLKFLCNPVHFILKKKGNNPFVIGVDECANTVR